MEKILSFRPLLSGSLNEFLESEDMECPKTGRALVELVVRLSSYREEGVNLFPKVLVCDDLAHVKKLLQCSSSIEIGSGPRHEDSMNQALKRCAPLARVGWAIYVHRAGETFRYGVLREPSSPVSLDIRDSIADLAGQVTVLVVSQLGDKAVEIVGGKGRRQVVHFSAAREEQVSPRLAVEMLAKAVSQKCLSGLQEALASFLRNFLSSALRRGHGALVAVVDSDGSLPSSWSGKDEGVDGVVLDEPIDLASAIEAYRREESATTLAYILSLTDLVEGMLSSDGITLFGSTGKVLGYNIFVRTPENNGALPSSMVGGARRRAYRTLEGLVERKELLAAFFRSSDGNTEFVGGDLQ